MVNRKRTNPFIKAILWVLIAFFAIISLAFFPSVTSIVLLIAAGLCLPIPKVQTFYRKVFPKKRLQVIIVIVLFLVGIFISPSQPVEDGTSLHNLETTQNSTVETTELPTVDETQSTQAETTELTVIPTESTSAPTEAATVSTEPPENTTAPTIAPEHSTFSIHFIDVRQADAALVECDGHYMLIDGGNKADSNVIYSVLKKASVPKLDIVVGTHAHEDHIGGLPGAYNYTTADMTLCPVTNYDSDAFEDFARHAEQNGGGITIPDAGDVYNLGTSTVTILGVNEGSDTNDTSIVLRIDYGQTSFLFTGDAEREAEQALLNAGMDLTATVLKVGHHGSDTSTSYAFLREIMPQYAIISVGAGNSYGHPTEETLSRLRDADVELFRTDLQGDIICTSDGSCVNVSVSRNANADVFSGIGSNSVNTEPTPTEAPTTEPIATDPPETTPPETTPLETEPPVTEDSSADYVVNTNTGKFHETHCRHVEDIKDKNRWDYHGTRDELVSSGYKPCKVCKP